MLALPGHTSEQRTGKNQKPPLDRKSPIQVRIHLPPAESLLRTSLSAHEEVPRARRGKEARMEDGAGPRALAAAERAALARRRGPPSTRTLIEIALKQASACPHAGAGGARSRAISVRLESDDRLYIVAPFGLADLFARRLRPNPRRRTVG